MSIRKKYNEYGVDKYYLKYASEYSNPHAKMIKELLISNEALIDYNNVFDLSAGSGLVSSILIELGYLIGGASDPYLSEVYQKKLKLPCKNVSFLDIVRDGLREKYSCIICSFALHLCRLDLLHDLVVQLFLWSNMIVIITPHKRPQLELIKNINIKLVQTNHVKDQYGKKTFLKIYKLI